MDVEKIFDRIKSEDFVLISTINYADHYIYKYGYACDLTFARERFFPASISLATYKGFPFYEQFNTR